MPWLCQAGVGVHSDTVHTAVDPVKSWLTGDTVYSQFAHSLKTVYSQFKHSLSKGAQFKHRDKIYTAVDPANSWLTGDTVSLKTSIILFKWL